MENVKSLLHRGAASEANPPAPILRKGFRIFFLLATAFAPLSLSLWVVAALGGLTWMSHFGAALWHPHEMIFGYAVAVIAGFLLTAVGNWTERETATGPKLLALAMLWVLGRIVCIVPIASPWVTALIDLAFLPLLGFTLALPIFASRNWRNLVMLAVVLVLFLSNTVMHLDALGIAPGWGRLGALVGLDVVVVLLAILSGRVIPMFTRNGLSRDAVKGSPFFDRLTLGVLVALLVLDAGRWLPGASPWLAGVGGSCVILRMRHWGSLHTFKTPLLWVLHLGHLWIAFGLFLRLASHLFPITTSLSTHALTVGALGSLTVGMMARVSLGHTGRPLTAPRTATWAFVLITLAAFVRVGLPLSSMNAWRLAVHISGTLWSVACALLFIGYFTVWTRARTDGKTG